MSKFDKMYESMMNEAPRGSHNKIVESTMLKEWGDKSIFHDYLLELYNWYWKEMGKNWDSAKSDKLTKIIDKELKMLSKLMIAKNKRLTLDDLKYEYDSIVDKDVNPWDH
jgi:hypothetical protein